MVTYSVKGEAAHAMGARGVERIRRWLDDTVRFRINYAAHNLDPSGKPYSQVNLPLLDDSVESFDLVGDILGPDTRPTRTVYVECKNYSAAGDQGSLYDEYLAVAYSAFARAHALLKTPPSYEFMWVTTHPFSQGAFSKLTTEPQIAEACAKPNFAGRLGGDAYSTELGGILASRLWLCVVTDRMLEEMIMGPEIRGAVAAKMMDLQGRSTP